ncbi:Proteasome inhibitor PI31 subunit [Holothuria leucospilota]|uniref:Proteasome inhibitor PI31 subunit n=1 Tax=Holothuria leucospilota TaxID=206669 RepID=A0A9Q0YFA4_HOLLE|nr:Proteasome inhibitor PI31 subunit [Holothuria leucospilota]
MASCPGLEMFYAGVQSQIKSQHDVIVCFLHWSFVQSGFKCTGLGEDEPSSNKSEILPPGWNTSDENYVLRYEPADSKDVHCLKILRIEDTLLIHILRNRDNKVVDVSLKTSDFINADGLQDFSRCFKDLNKLKELVFDQLFKGLKEEAKRTSSSAAKTSSDTRTYTEDRRQEEDPLRVPTRQPPYRTEPDWNERVDPFSVGRGDLDPFSGASPGMLMDPMRGGFPGPRMDPTRGLGMPGRLPRGAVPPGARFDPIGPPRPDSGRNPMHPYSGEPNPDHMRPPGYDDMFM